MTEHERVAGGIPYYSSRENIRIVYTVMDKREEETKRRAGCKKEEKGCLLDREIRQEKGDSGCG